MGYHCGPMSMGLIQILHHQPRYWPIRPEKRPSRKPKTRLRGRAPHGRQLLDACSGITVTPAPKVGLHWANRPDIETGFDQLKSKAASGFRASG